MITAKYSTSKELHGFDFKDIKIFQLSIQRSRDRNF